MANQIVVSAGAKVRNLSGVLTATSGVVSSLPIDGSLGIPQLDVNGKILVSQLPNSVMEYKGTWSAATNTPTLANGTGNQGDVYLCNVAGTVDFGAGPIVFFVGDQVIYSGSIWQRASGATGTVTSVAVTESGDSLNITGSPITTSGTINIGFNGTNLQYVNGAGNLTTFPDLTGYVPYTGATANVNIGTHSFIANNGTYNSEMSPSLFGVENAAGTIFGVLEYNKLTLTNSTGVGSVMEVNAQGLIFPDASVQISSYTDAKARLSLSLTTTGTSGVATYNNTTGVFNIPNYGSALSGYVPYTGATADVDLDTHVLNAQALHVKGTAGYGHLGLKHQSASPTGNANESLIFADVNGDMGWLNGNLYLHKFITSANTANRSYTFPNATCNIPNDSLVVHLAGTETITGAKTFSGYTTFTSTVDITSGLTFSNSGFTLVLQPPTLSVNRTVTLPNATGTLALTSDLTDFVTLSTAQTISGIKTFSSSILSSGIGFFSTIGGTNYGGIVGTPTYFQISAGGGSSILLKSDNGTNAIIINTLGKVDFGSTIGNGTYTYTLPSATGTIALVGGSGVGTVTSVAALTIGTSGTDLSSSVANSTTTPVITLNVPTASATNRGALSSADWTTFNNKQSALTNPVTGTGTTNYLPKFTGASTIGNSLIFDNGTNVGIGNATPNRKFIVQEAGTSTSGNVIGVRNDNSTSGAYINFIAGGGNAPSIGAKGNDITFTADGYGGTELLRVTGTGNLGLGVTPSAWSGFTALDISNVGCLAAYPSFGVSLFRNAYYDGSVYRYKITSAASYYDQDSNGQHIWYKAPSGTAGAAITFTQAMTLFSTGNLSIANTTDSGYKLDVNGTGRFIGALNVSAAAFDGTTADTIYFSHPSYPTTYRNKISTSVSAAASDQLMVLSVGNGASTYNNVLTLRGDGRAQFSSSVASASNFSVARNGSNSVQAGYILETISGTLYLSNFQLNASGGLSTWTYNPTNGWVERATIATTGAATFYSSVTATSFFESSSIKGKDIIATNPLLALDIDVIKYTRKSDESKDIRYGYSAEQIHSLMPELTDKDVTAVKYLDVHTILIANLQKEIRELKAKINN
jgi:hypothetical protein